MSSFFDDLSSKYRCCCGCMHVKTGTILFCVLFLLNNFVNVIYLVSNGDHDLFPWIQNILQFAIYLGPLIGIKKTNSKFFLPCLIVTVLQILYLFIVIIFGVIGCFPQTSLGQKIQDLFKEYCHCEPDETEIFYVFIMMIAIFTVSLLFVIWVFRVIYKCYKYISEKSESKKYPYASGVIIF